MFEFQIFTFRCTNKTSAWMQDYIYIVYLFYFSSFIHDSNYEIENSSHLMNF
jgi:hypothetical protein